MFTPNIIPVKQSKREMNRKKSNFDAVCLPLVFQERKTKKKISLLFGKYQIYFISCAENIRNFMRAMHS